MIIYHHSDFDGAVSAAIFCDFIKNYQGYEEDIRFVPVNYPSMDVIHKPGDVFTVLDFQYLDGATWFFDHHKTSFRDESHKERMDNKQLFWDPESKSNVGLIYRSLCEVYHYERDLIDLVKWSDIIDSAGYESVEQALDYSIPALKIHAALFYADTANNFTVSDFIKYLLEYDFDLEKISEIPIVRFLAKEAEVKIDRDSSAYSKNLDVHEHGKVITWDTSTYFRNPNRFIPFLLEKNSYYSIGIRKSSSGYEIAYGKNPWCKKKSIVNTGKVLKDLFGGGGHFDVAGASFKDYNSARQAQLQLIEITVNAIKEQTGN